MKRVFVLLFLFSSSTFASQKAIKTTLGEASVNTPYSTCAAGDNSSGSKSKESKNTDSCYEAGIPAGICAACGGNPSDSSQTCRDAIENYKKLGIY